MSAYEPQHQHPEHLLRQVQDQLAYVSKRIDEALPRTHRKRSKKVKTDGPILADDLGLESPGQEV